MHKHIFSRKITCAYLYTITRYGYPPDIRQTVAHIEEMAALGFTSIELEGIEEKNIRYLYDNRAAIGDALAAGNCTLPVLCIVLPQLSAVQSDKRAASLELFEMGCELAKYLGARGVLDNGPWLPLQYPENAPVVRHYSGEHLAKLGLPHDFKWSNYWTGLTETYRHACVIAANYQLDYHMHPCEGSLIVDTDSFLNFSQAVNSPNLMFNLDTANQHYFRDNLALSILRLKDRISYIHISDNTGNRVEHLVPGDGKIHWDSFFTALKEVGYSGNFAIDVGGAESGINDIDAAYKRTALWIGEQINQYSLNN